MWLSFYLCWIAGAIFLVVPGMLVARGLRTDWTFALLVSPLISCGIYGVLPIIYDKLGIPCGWQTMVLPVALAGIALCLLGKLLKLGPLEALSISDGLKNPISERHRISIVAISIVIAVATGVTMSLVIWVSSLSSPEDFLQLYDNGWHLTRIARFIEESNYSPFLDGHVYPSCWHGIAAMLGSLFGVKVSVAENAAILVFASVAYPLSSLLLLATLFGDKPRRVLLGAIFCFSIAFFPWRPMLWGPLFPNVAAFVVMPAEAALFIRLVRDGKGLSDRLLTGLFFVVGGMSMALLQPNAIFSCGVFLIPFCLSNVRQVMAERRGLKAGIIAELALLIVFVAIWIGLVYAPFMKSIVWYTRSSRGDVMQAVRWGLDLCFIMRRQQYFIGVAVVLGGLAVLRERKTYWISFSYALTLALYIVAWGVPAPFKNIITGFWYSDIMRLSSAVCVFAIPLIACGMDTLVGIVMWPFSRPRKGDVENGQPRAMGPMGFGLAALVVVAMLVVSYFPLEIIPPTFRSYAFDTVRHNVWTTTSSTLYEYAPLPPEEAAFVEKVADIVGDDVVFNQPFDGSVFAYSIYGINAEFRYLAEKGTITARHLKTDINNVASDKQVQDEVEELGVVYLLMLDQGDSELGMSENASYFDLGYVKQDWRGFNAVQDDTPGFTLVLSEGDMRLYKLESAA